MIRALSMQTKTVTFKTQTDGRDSVPGPWQFKPVSFQPLIGCLRSGDYKTSLLLAVTGQVIKNWPLIGSYLRSTSLSSAVKSESSTAILLLVSSLCCTWCTAGILYCSIEPGKGWYLISAPEGASEIGRGSLLVPFILFLIFCCAVLDNWTWKRSD